MILLPLLEGDTEFVVDPLQIKPPFFTKDIYGDALRRTSMNEK